MQPLLMAPFTRSMSDVTDSHSLCLGFHRDLPLMVGICYYFNRGSGAAQYALYLARPS